MTKNDVLFYARIRSIEFVDYRNIENGIVDFPNAEFNEYLVDEKPSILGIYGQNGSGKSSVIMALGILKDVLSGKPLDNKYESCIKKGKEKCTLNFIFNLYSKTFNNEGKNIVQNNKNICYEVSYKFDITYREETDKTKKLHIENEIFKYRVQYADGTKIIPKNTYIDTSNNSNNNWNIFGSEDKKKMYTNNGENYLQTLRELKAISYENSRSFIFMPKVIETISKGFSEFTTRFENIDDIRKMDQDIYKLNGSEEVKKTIESMNQENLEDAVYLWFLKLPLLLVYNLMLFGNSYLYVVDTVTTGITNINSVLPLFMMPNSGPMSDFDNNQISINMDGSTSVSEKAFPFIKKTISSISSVLEKLVPGLSLNVIDLQPSLMSDNQIGHCFEIITNRDGTLIPLKYESDGIRRIISVLNLLISVYNHPSFTLAIDEIDSGIFEYLLGEILTIMSESAKGQLIFTSHNLRPLEVLPPKYLCFTTVNESNRFTRLSKRGNSNLRDNYFRSIELNTQNESIYNSTDKYDIELALYKAGHSEEL